MTLDAPVFGFLPVNKPAGPTSHDMVYRIRQVLPKKVKAGHTGSLDPFATGVLILSLGKATRFTDDVHELSKSYRALIELGVRTDTLDNTGVIDLEMPIPAFSDEDLAKAASHFTGTYDQTPPAYSAKKVGGRKSYELARKNKAVALVPKQITVHELRLARRDESHILCDVSCSTGSYIRVLGKEIAEFLGTCGRLEALTRTSIGPITLDHCLDPDQMTPGNWADRVLTVSQLLPHLPEVAIDKEARDYLVHGRPFPTRDRFPDQFLGVYRGEDGVVDAIFRCVYNTRDGVLISRFLCYSADA